MVKFKFKLHFTWGEKNPPHLNAIKGHISKQQGFRDTTAKCSLSNAKRKGKMVTLRNTFPAISHGMVKFNLTSLFDLWNKAVCLPTHTHTFSYSKGLYENASFAVRSDLSSVGFMGTWNRVIISPAHQWGNAKAAFYHNSPDLYFQLLWHCKKEDSIKQIL